MGIYLVNDCNETMRLVAMGLGLASERLLMKLAYLEPTH